MVIEFSAPFDARGGYHRAVDVARHQMAIQGVVAGAGFIRDMQGMPAGHDSAQRPIHLSQPAADRAVVAHLPARIGLRQGDVNRILVTSIPTKIALDFVMACLLNPCVVPSCQPCGPARDRSAQSTILQKAGHLTSNHVVRPNQ